MQQLPARYLKGHVDLPGLFEKYKGQYYPDVYMLSKSLAEHMLVREVEKKQGNGGHQFPIAILRLSPVGPSVCEPLVGWVSTGIVRPCVSC